MTYTKKGPFQNNVAAPPLNAAFFDGLETVAATAVTTAPAPSGDTTGVADTAALQPLITAAQNTGGTVILQAGTYYTTGLATASSYYQPRIVGQGRQYTFLQAVGAATPFTIVGISGAVVGGEITELAVVGPSTSTTAPTNVGIELIGVCGMKIDVEFRYLAVGLRYHNRDSGMFTEFCVATECVWTFVTTAIHYKVTSGNESFHGSGIRGGVINPSIGATGPFVQIDNGAFPYNAPMSPTVFPKTPNTNIITNNSTSRPASFVGDLKIECQNASPTVIAAATGNYVYLAGNVTALGGILRLGRAYLVHKVYYQGTAVIPYLKPFQRYTTLAAGTSTLIADPLYGNSWYQIAISITNADASYFYSQLLFCWQSPTGSNGAAAVQGTGANTDTHTYGPPVYGWNNGLTVTNANYTSAFNAAISVTPFYGNGGNDNLGQF